MNCRSAWASASVRRIRLASTTSIPSRSRCRQDVFQKLTAVGLKSRYRVTYYHTTSPGKFEVVGGKTLKYDPAIYPLYHGYAVGAENAEVYEEGGTNIWKQLAPKIAIAAVGLNVAAMTQANRIRLAFTAQFGERSVGMVEWVDGSGNTVDQLTFDALIAMGYRLRVAVYGARLTAGSFETVATAWPREAPRREEEPTL